MGAAGGAIIFVVAVAGMAVWGVPTFTYTAHSFLTVLTQTANGVDKFRWPEGEFIMDWLGKTVALGLLLTFWAVTLTIFFAPFFLASPLAFGIFIPVFFWLVFPVSLFSMLQSGSWLAVLYPPILPRMVRRPLSFFFVAVVTLIPAAIAAACIYGILLFGIFMLLPAAIAVSLNILFYARIWGCYGYLIFEGLGDQTPRRPKKDNVQIITPESEAARRGFPVPGVEAIPEVDVEMADEPTVPDVPEEEEDEWTPNKKPYKLLDDNRAASQWKSQERRTATSTDEDDEGGYGVAEPVGADSSQEERDRVFSVSKYYEKRRKLEAERAARSGDTFLDFGKGRASAWILLTHSFPFLLYDTTTRALASLIFLYTLWLGLFVTAIRFFPVGL